MKNHLILVAASVIALAAPLAGRADSLTPIHVFGSVRCGACLEAKQYLEFVAAQEKADVTFHNVGDDLDAAELSQRVARDLGVRLNTYPLIVVGDEPFMGWTSAAQGPKVVSAIQRQRSEPRDDAVAAAARQLAAEKVAKANRPSPGPLDVLKIIGVGLAGFLVFALGIWTYWRESGQTRLPVKKQ
jgi:hypothetical protein